MPVSTDPFAYTRLQIPDRSYYRNMLTGWLKDEGIVIEGHYIRTKKRGNVHVRTGREVAAFLDGYLACKGGWSRY